MKPGISFTRGPWTVGKQRKIYAGHPAPVAQTLAVEGNYHEAKANARLIATAPDMYHLLLIVREALWADGRGSLVDEVDDVLAHADGVL